MKWLVPLFVTLAGLAGCAQQAAPGGTAPHPETVAALARLPPSFGAWERRPLPSPEGDALTGLRARYVRKDGLGWATVFIGRSSFGSPDAGPIPDGAASPLVQRFLAYQPPGQRVLRAEGNAPGVPPQRCVLGVPAPAARMQYEAACVTGAGGQYVRIRATYIAPAQAPEEQERLAQSLLAVTTHFAGVVTAMVARGGP